MFIALLITLVVLVVTYFKWSYQYWKKRNLPYVEPRMPFGSAENPYTRTLTFSETIKNIYGELKSRDAKHGGFYVISNPVYMPIDLEFVKNVLTKDFHHFSDRGTFHNEKDEPLTAHLFAIGGAKWKNLRVKLTPTFTSGKMRTMFNTLRDCTVPFEALIDDLIACGEPIDIKSALERFTIDVIGSCAFGLDCNSTKDETSEFRRYGRQFFVRSKLRSLLNSLGFAFPTISKALGFRAMDPEVARFYMKVVEDIVSYRERNGEVRNDFMQTLINLKNEKFDAEGETGQHDGKGLTLEEIAAQCFVFFIAGFETSSTVMTFALLEMARNQDVQEKAREEVETVLAKYGGELTYDAVSEMKYLGQVIDESMRLYPPLAVLVRRCVKDYLVPGTDVVVEKGTRCMISALGIHRDPEYYDEPESFNPDRFSDEAKRNRHPYAFIPFGEGPRNCIGLRFGLMQSKVGLSLLLRHFRFTLDKKTKLPIKFSNENLIITAEGGVWLRAERLST